MGHYFLNHLHTNYSKYWDKSQSFRGVNNETATRKQLDKKKRMLQAEESKLYNLFGFNTYEEFIKFLRSTLFKNKGDADVIKRFSASNLNNYLTTFAQKQGRLLNQTVEFKLKMKNKKQVEEFKMALAENKISALNFKTVKGELVFQAGFNAAIVRQIGRTFFGKNFAKRITNMNKATSQFVDRLINEGAVSLVTNSGKVDDITNYVANDIYNNFPWGYTPTEIKRILSIDGTGAEKIELERAEREAKRYIMNELGQGGSHELRLAMARVLKEVDFTHFSVGNNLLNGLKGALGEFSTAVILEYMNITLKGRVPKLPVEILGNMLTAKGEKTKMDIMLGATAIQVKNIAPYYYSEGKASRSTVQTSVHPIDFANRVGASDLFLTTLANYYFNSTFQASEQSQFNTIEEYVADNIEQVLNLRTKENMEETVSFYFISNQYLVPGSEMIEALYQRNINSRVTITGPEPVISDEEGVSEPAKFIPYWRRSSLAPEGWKPTTGSEPKSVSGGHDAAFKKLVGHDISLRAAITANSKTPMSRYSIY